MLRRGEVEKVRGRGREEVEAIADAEAVVGMDLRERDRRAVRRREVEAWAIEGNDGNKGQSQFQLSL